MPDFSQLFLYIPGIIIFLAGSGQVRRWMRMHKSGACSDGVVISCSHIVKKDRKERDIYNYYDVLFEYEDPKSRHKVRRNIKSPTEYAVGQDVRVFWGTGNEKAQLTEREEEMLFSPWALMIGGALLIVLALEQNQGNQIPAMAALAAVLAGAGILMLYNYFSLKKRKLQKIDGEIIELYTRQISKETKIVRGNKFTYYPVVRFSLHGKENIRRCNINTSGVNTFKIGDPFPLYYDEQKGIVLERNARLSIALLGGISLAAGLAAGLSILSVL